MPSIDMPYDRLVEYRPAPTRRPDFEEFWRDTLTEARAFDIDARLERIDYPVPGVEVNRLTFAGWGGHPVGGWYLRPAVERPPALLVYHGYSGGAGEPAAYLQWVMLGCAVVTIDTRGQGGRTGDQGGYEGGSVQGWMTQGIELPEEYFYRRVYTDCVRAVDFVCGRPELDTSRLAAAGGSQGGGLTIAAAGLDERIKLAMPDVPFLCHFERAIQIALAGPYLELQNYCARFGDRADRAIETLSYFDGMNLAADIAPDCRMLWSVGLWDDVCPPSTVYAAYHASGAGQNEMAVYRYNKHEGGGALHNERKLAWLAAELRR